MCPSLANFAGGTTPRVVHSGKTVYGHQQMFFPAEMARTAQNGATCKISVQTPEKSFLKWRQPRKVTHITRIGGIGHDFEPALKGGDLKEGKVGPADIVKLHFRVTPLCVILLEASRNVWDDFWIDRQAGSYVKALKLGEEGN